MLTLNGPCFTSCKQLKPPDDLTKPEARANVPPPLTNTLPVGKPLTTPLKPKPAVGDGVSARSAAVAAGEELPPEGTLAAESGRSGFVFEQPIKARVPRTTTIANFFTGLPFLFRAQLMSGAPGVAELLTRDPTSSG